MAREVMFTVDALEPILDRMAELADGSGWMVLDAAVAEDDVPPPPALAGLFSAKGPAVPELSWVPGAPGGRRVEPLAIGIRHASGPKAERRLAAAGHPVPDGWYLIQDNPKRGLVAQVPDSVSHAAVLDWLLGAAAILTTVPLTGEWRARIHFR
ncbi:MAG: hypothetical protein ABW310_17255 [Acidimicrobiales bacterium]